MTASEFKPAPGSIPVEPGVYRFCDGEGRVIYVGKAKSLRQRISSYFAESAPHHPRTQSMLATARSVDWVVVGSEVEALQLEYSWIKEFDPRFNVKYRDDKSYPYLAVTLGELYPRALVTRGAKRTGTRYFGPYAHAWAIRETLDILLRVFPVRTCGSGVFQRAKRSGRPCLLADIGKCSGPCVGRVSEEEHRAIALDLCDFLGGSAKPIQRRLTAEMKAASDAQDYERAARLRDDLAALDRALERNFVVFDESVDADIIGCSDDELEAAFEVFHVRGGRIRGQRSFIVEKVEESSRADMVGGLLAVLYADATAEDIPPEILVPERPSEEVGIWLSDTRRAKVAVRVPQRGSKRELLETVTRNASERLALHKARRSGDLTARSRALAEIQEGLDLADAPLRIECIDISHLGGEDVVGSLVVFEDGAARPKEYRTFAISTEGSGDDLASVREVVRRRFRDRKQDSAGTRVFAYEPNLLLIDGAQPQAAVAADELAAAGVHGVAVAGLAKRLEEVWLPGSNEPVLLPRTSEGLYLLQRIRDEAHRVALRYQSRKRMRSRSGSALDDVPGLGAKRAAALLRTFGSVRRIAQADAIQLQQVPGIGPSTAQAVLAALNGPDSQDAAATSAILGEGSTMPTAREGES